jgi:hypothetical protein
MQCIEYWANFFTVSSHINLTATLIGEKVHIIVIFKQNYGLEEKLNNSFQGTHFLKEDPEGKTNLPNTKLGYCSPYS